LKPEDPDPGFFLHPDQILKWGRRSIKKYRKKKYFFGHAWRIFKIKEKPPALQRKHLELVFLDIIAKKKFLDF
jgi:hypothetical protein